MSEAPKPESLETHIRASSEREKSVFRLLEQKGDTGMYGVLHSKEVGRDGYFGKGNLSFLPVFPEGVAGIARDVASVHERGKKVLMLDLLGQGEVCFRLGADAVLATTATEVPHYSKVEALYGDAFRSGVINELLARIQALKSEGHELTTGFFRPYGGIDLVQANVFVHIVAYEMLRRLYAEFGSEGKIFLQVRGFEGGHMLGKIIYIYGLGAVFKQSNGMAYLQKKEDVVLPSLHTIAERMPELKESLVVMGEYDWL